MPGDSLKVLPNSTPIGKLGFFTSAELRKLSPKVNKLTRGDLISLMDSPKGASLQLTVADLRGLQSVVTKVVAARTRPSPGCCCCCCAPGCCCCCAVLDI